MKSTLDSCILKCALQEANASNQIAISTIKNDTQMQASSNCEGTVSMLNKTCEFKEQIVTFQKRRVLKDNSNNHFDCLNEKQDCQEEVDAILQYLSI